MSALFFFSSDYPLEEIKNPHYKTFSVNEALAFGLELPDLVLNSKTIDRDKPDTILWSDLGIEIKIDPITRKVIDNGIADDFSIRTFETFSEIYTTKKYQAKLEWDVYSDGRAERVVEYIRKHMESAEELEIWHVWLSSYEVPNIRKVFVDLQDVTIEMLKTIDEADISSEPLTHVCYVLKKR